MQAYKVDFTYKNNIELLDMALYLYSKTVLDKELSKKRLVMLREYLLNGYNNNTKKALEINLQMTRANVNTQNWNLQRMGFLIPDPNKQINKMVSKELINLRDMFMNTEDKRLFIVNFIKDVR